MVHIIQTNSKNIQILHRKTFPSLFNLVYRFDEYDVQNFHTLNYVSELTKKPKCVLNKASHNIGYKINNNIEKYNKNDKFTRILKI